MKTIYILGETKIKMVVCLQNRGLVDEQIYILCFVQRSVLVDSSLHKKWSFPLGIFWVNMTKLAVSWKFGYTYLMGNFIFLQWLSQYTFLCSKSEIETLRKGVIYVLSWQQIYQNNVTNVNVILFTEVELVRSRNQVLKV